ncbi:hypothetical protein CONPUDRAFT_97818 [Coniophora puteana RWD-64-598 SS2]|uniref:Snf7-domain-containing protein n=1 Tax=Coniophora puteana (strain RWD-64-598) TaxID=741705 RepID=A0A5M3N152_CONPW|nr:uncharacterized protein CONPUDRAFT_97818 [Coniophora puteana RWD-64-598 SS2]EIW85108.1 hypothetical protein CONPUDRAFT_97818 [Coniophora puteana RWD-64-598 SS2]
MTNTSALTALPPYASISKSRLSSLYSDVSRQKRSNPSSYGAHVDWWQNTLELLSSHGWIETSPADIHPTASSQSSKLILTVQRSLVDKLRVEGIGKPLGLGSTIVELCRQKALIPCSHFLTSQQSIYDAGWLPWRLASFVIGKPLWWALEQLDIVRSEDSYSEAEVWKRIEGDYVLLHLAEEVADAVLQLQKSREASLGDRLYTTESFRTQFASRALPGVQLSDQDIRVLLRFLERERRQVVVDNDLVKFLSAGEKATISPVDKGILELKAAVGRLHAQVDSIQVQVDGAAEKASAALRLQRKPFALAQLKHKKHLHDLLLKRLGALENLESTLVRVEGAAGDIEIMKLYESSTKTLQEILSHPSLEREKIDETMDALAASNAEAREVDDAIRMGEDIVTEGYDIADADIEAELNALVKDAEHEREIEREKTVLQALERGVPTAPPESAKEIKVRAVAVPY